MALEKSRCRRKKVSPAAVLFWHVYDRTSFSIVFWNKRFMLLHPTLLVNWTSISLVTYICSLPPPVINNESQLLFSSDITVMEMKNVIKGFCLYLVYYIRKITKKITKIFKKSKKSLKNQKVWKNLKNLKKI